MPENWGIHWEDYYEVLQIHPSAEPEIIKAAYGKLAQKYHPDTNKDPAAGERMKKINLAHEVLSNPEKRKQYDAEWLRKGDVTSKSSSPRPKPVINPQYIRFDGARPGEIQTSSFVIRNIGGPYGKIWVSNPDSWVKVVGYTSLTNSDELPLQVKIEAEGDDWDKSYSESIGVRLDEEETQVRVELRTKSVPMGEKTTVGTKRRTGYAPPPPPVRPKHGMPTWGKWVVGLAIFFLIIGVVRAYEVSHEIGKTAPLSSPTKTQTASETRTRQVEEGLKRWHQNNMPDSYYNPKGYVIVGEHIWALMGPPVYSGLGRIIHSVDNGNNWEIQWEGKQVTLNRILFMNESEGIVSISGKTLIKTSDGGKTWDPFFSLSNMPDFAWSLGPSLESVTAKDKYHIIVTMRGHVNETIETADGGKTWELIYYHGSYYGNKRGVLRTYDGGKSWQKINVKYQ